MSITVPRAFQAAATTAGLKPSGKPDLALIVRDPGAPPAASAAVFTRNQIVGAPVAIARRLRGRVLEGTGRPASAILVNAGNSNTATGEQGERDARACMAAVGAALGREADEVLPSSTGVIGRLLPTARIISAVPGLVRTLARGPEADAAAATAIMTTDLVPKTALREWSAGAHCIRIGAIAKGSGMIAPRLDSAARPVTPAATMLAFITTDAAITSRALQSALDAACAGSFNRISVDNHPSCSDSAVCLASGAAEGVGGSTLSVMEEGSAGFRRFCDELGSLCTDLATQIVADGEGATRVFRVRVNGARTDAEAEAMAREGVTSPLVKCAIHGRDPNWGRIVTAAGNAGIGFDPSEAALSIGPVEVYRAGMPLMEALNDARLAEAMAGPQVECVLTVGRGTGSAWMMGCDLSARYVSINADYTT
ncbi:MAG: bifunctional glutamate N-acetyltransferase/amino-acid acetyltransferase ArgJ [Phycisphaerales bacterium]